MQPAYLFYRPVILGPVFLACLLLGCSAGPRPMVSLESDSHSSDIYEALVFGKVRIEGMAFPWTDKHLSLTLWKINADPSPNNWISLSMAMNTSDEEPHVLEVPFVLEVVPGEYDLRSIGLTQTLAGEESIYFHPGKKREPAYQENPQHQFTVTSHSLTYLGTIEIRVQSLPDQGPMVKKEILDFTYSMTFENHFEKDALFLKMKYPNLYDTYKGSVYQFSQGKHLPEQKVAREERVSYPAGFA